LLYTLHILHHLLFEIVIKHIVLLFFLICLFDLLLHCIPTLLVGSLDLLLNLLQFLQVVYLALNEFTLIHMVLLLLDRLLWLLGG
jgi:hypothetical protein